MEDVQHYLYRLDLDMMRNVKQILYIFFCAAILMSLWGCMPARADIGEAINGKLDLRSETFEKNGLVQLHGKWEFYWNQTIDPMVFQNRGSNSGIQPTGYLDTPGVWNFYKLNGTNLPGYGHATIRVTIKVPKPGLYGVKLYGVDSSYRLYINGELKAEVGHPGTNAGSTTPAAYRIKAFTMVTNDTFDLVMQIANYYHRKGGPEDNIFFGKMNALLDNDQSLITYETALFGTLCIIIFYHLVMYLFRRKDSSLLFFALFCTAVLFRLSSTGEKVMYMFYPGIPYEMDYKLQYLSFYYICIMVFEYVTRLFRNYFHRGVIKAYWLFTALITVVTVVTPVSVYSHLMLATEVIYSLGMIYLLIKMISSVKKGEKGAGIFLAGIAVLLLTFANDALYTNNVIATGYIFPYGTLIFMYLQVFIYSRKYTMGLNTEEALAEELSQKKIELEKEMKERKEYAEQLKILSTRQIRSEEEERRRIAIELHDSLGQYLSIAQMKMDKSMKTLEAVKKKDETMVSELKETQRLIQESLEMTRTLTFELSPPIIYDLGLEDAIDWLAESLEKKFCQKIVLDLGKKRWRLSIEKRLFLFRSTQELIMNAIKYAKANEIKVRTEMIKAMYVVTVSDNGFGFELSQIFSGEKEKLTFGLMSIYERASHLGGEVKVESEVGKGTTVTVKVPVRD